MSEASAPAPAPADQDPVWKYNNKTYKSAADCLTAVIATKNHARAKYWNCLTVETVEENGIEVVKVRCSHCNDVYSICNIAGFGSSHFLEDFTTCVKAAGSSRGGRKRTAGAGDPPSSVASSKRSKHGMAEFFVPRSVAMTAQERLYMFFFSNPTVSLKLIEDPYLVASYGAMGITLPSRNTLSGVILDRVHADVHMKVLGKVFGPSTKAAAALQPNMVDQYGVLDLPTLGKAFILIVDGWRKKAAAQGTPLINIMAAANEGRAAFLKAVPVAGVTKDANWHLEFLTAAAQVLSDGVMQRCGGVNMDGTSTNRKAMRELEDKYQHMVNLVCAAHSLDLLLKDLGNGGSKETACGRVLQQAKALAGAVGECEKLRALVQLWQVDKYDKTIAFPSHCPTRFGVLVEIGQVVLRNKEAIKATCADEAFDNIAAGSTNAAAFAKIAVGPGCTTFWQSLASVLELLQPVRDAIHQLEGDQAMLSQLRGVWSSLHKHFLQWHAKLADTSGLKADNVPEVLRQRKEKSMHDATLVAYALDPLNFKESSDQWTSPAAQLSSAEEKRAKKLLYRLLDANSEAAQKVVQKEWSRFKLAALPEEVTSDLAYLTEREQQGTREVIRPVMERVGWWDQTASKKFPKLAIVARRLLPRHVTSAAAERNWSQWGLVFHKLRNRLSLDKAGKLVFIAGNKGCLASSNPEHAVVLSLLEEEEVTTLT